jgi:DNA-binding NarL/FixJ family response regulator
VQLNDSKPVFAMTDRREHKIINVIIADDHQLFVESLKLLLQTNDSYHFNITNVAYNGDELLDLLRVHKPDLLLLDINLPSKNGLEVLQEVKKSMKGTRILVLTMYDDPKIIKSAFDHKVDGYILKNCGKEELLNAIDTIFQGEVFLGKGVSVANHQTENSTFEDIFQKKFSLTKREVEVLRLITQARNNHSIASELYISEQTAAVHRKNIMRKIGVNSTAALIRVAYDNSLI